MGKDPAVLFYPADFLTGVMLMDYDSRGRYITLLSLQQQIGTIKEKDFKKISGEKFEEIAEKFEQDSKGNYFNRRMKDEMNKRKKFTESRRSNGSKGGRPRKDMDKQEESYEKPSGFHMGNHMGNENENEIENVNEKCNDVSLKYGEFKNVKLSEEELEKLKVRFPYDWQERIERLSSYMSSKGKRYKSHYATILNWARKEQQKESCNDFLDL